MAQAHSSPLIETAPQERNSCQVFRSNKIFFSGHHLKLLIKHHAHASDGMRRAGLARRETKSTKLKVSCFQKPHFFSPYSLQAEEELYYHLAFKIGTVLPPMLSSWIFWPQSLFPHLSLGYADSILPLLWNLKAHNSYCHKREAKVGTSLKSLTVCRQNAF